jgi:hypothetical protein
MTLLSVRHITRYAYKAPVRFGDHRWMWSYAGIWVMTA